ncbi:MAG: YkgJ family cysteine cluster protein [Phycisphaeraceae bacterium]|nr:YkgJ family cysteine cluster protein [Phycisphaeraceae bacterium]
MSKRNQCELCHGQCCRYFALPIETPEDRDDYDDIRWYLCHEDVTVFVEEGDWYVNVKNKCRNLSKKDSKCHIYDRRPTICRGYSHDECDFVEGDYEYDLHFTDDTQMEEYIKVKFDNNLMSTEVAKKGASKAS